MQRQSITPFTQIAEGAQDAFASAPPVQMPTIFYDDVFGGVTQGISQTQVMESSEGDAHPPIEVDGVLGRVVDLHTGEKFEFKSDTVEISFGRAPQCTVSIKDPNVSSRHLCLFRDDFSFAIIDSSVNKTYLKGTQLVKGEPQRLKSGDEFSLVGNSFKINDNARHVYVC